MSMNSVSISGNLTRDCEVRQTPGGTNVTDFSVAVNERRKNQQTGEWEDWPQYVDCVLWGNLGPAIAPQLTKGCKVALNGKLRWHSWETDSGERRSKLDVVVNEIEVMPRGNGNAVAQQAPSMRPAAPAPNAAPLDPTSAVAQAAARAKKAAMGTAEAMQAGFPGARVTEEPAGGYYSDDIPF